MSRVDDLYEEAYGEPCKSLHAQRGCLNEATPEEWDHAGKTALEKQVGGRHYKDFAIQPIEFVMANKLDYCEANIVKYACRHHMKGGIQDVDKIIHYAQLLKEIVYAEG